MPTAIDDEFSAIPGRQRRYQLRNRAEGTCVGCRNPTEHGKRYCPACIKRTADKRAKTKHLHGAAEVMLKALKLASVWFEDDAMDYAPFKATIEEAIAMAEGRQLL